MTIQSKDDEVRQVVTQLDGLIAQLEANVAALTAVLVPSAPPDPHAQEVPAS